MKKLLRWTAIAIAMLVAIVIAGYGIVYLLAERKLGERFPIPPVTITVPTDSASIAEGGRLAVVRGCVGGCHGTEARGGVMFDEPIIARIVAPNLTAAVRRYGDAELVVAIRNGLRPDGRSMMVMPSEAFVALTDDDVGKIIAFLRSLPAGPGPDANVSPGPLGRFGIVTGKFKTVAQEIAGTVPPPEAAGDEAQRGRYLARSICGACHAPDLHGASNPSFTSADLALVAAYSADDFTRLMRTGVALGGRRVGVMSQWSPAHLAHLTDAEIAALYAYLRTLAGNPRN